MYLLSNKDYEMKELIVECRLWRPPLIIQKDASNRKKPSLSRKLHVTQCENDIHMSCLIKHKY